MAASMKRGKHVEAASHGVYSDIISTLPDELIGHILSFLPTTSAVTTCILSKRWKNLFTLTNCLSFNDAPTGDYYDPVLGETDEQGVVRKTRFQKFVKNVLELHQVSPIENFSVVCQDTYADSDWNAWISKAVQKGVRDLHCEVDDQHDILPNGLFTSQTLERFKMTGFFGHKYDLKVPLSAWLSSLKVLHLGSIRFFSHESVESLFTCCEMLEELTLDECDCDAPYHIVMSFALLNILTIVNCSFEKGLFEINAPNLARLSFINNTGVKIVPSWKESCSLAEAELSFCDGEEDNALILAAADKVTELHLSANSLKLLLTQAGREEMPDFPSLSCLHLSDCPFNEWKTVINVLDKYPQLETVTFQQCFYGQNNGGDADVLPPDKELMPFSCHAKVIEVHEFLGGEASLLYLRHLLSNAGDLKRLTLYQHHSVSTAAPLLMLLINDDFDMIQLLPRASKDCCIELKKCVYRK